MSVHILYSKEKGKYDKGQKAVHIPIVFEIFSDDNIYKVFIVYKIPSGCWIEYVWGPPALCIKTLVVQWEKFVTEFFFPLKHPFICLDRQ